MHSVDSDLLGTDPGYGLQWGVPATQSGDSLGLVLTGGGARAAYQVGVLRAIAALLQRGAPSPFPIICGTSAGAINAALLASNADSFRRGVARLLRWWRKIVVTDVYRGDLSTLARHAASLIGNLGGLAVKELGSC